MPRRRVPAAVEPARYRGLFLPLMLLTYALFTLTVALLETLALADDFRHGGTASVPLVLSLLCAVAELIALVALWFWRRWGLRLLGVLVAVELVPDLITLTGAGGKLLLTARLVVAGLLAWAVVEKWAQMDA